MKGELAGRPLLLASIALVAGVSSATHFLNLLILPILLWICWRRLTPALWVGASFLVGLLIAPMPAAISPAKGDWTGTGMVSSMPLQSFASKIFLLQTDRGTYQIVAKGSPGIVMGETLRVEGHLIPTNAASAEQLDRAGVVASIRCEQDNIEVLDKGIGWFRSARQMQDSFVSDVNRALPYHQAAMVNALTVAATGQVPAGTRNDLSRVGAAHIISASGLQVFLLAFMLQAILGLAPIPREWQIAVIVVVLVFYATATGLHPATLRTVLMASLAMAAYLFRREPDFLSALGAAAIITVLWQPWSVFSPGFQLSYATVGALSLYWKPFEEETGSKFWDRILGRIWFILRLSFIATLAAAPLSAYHFGVVSLISPLTNLLIGPVVPVIIASALAAWALGFLSSAFQVGLLKLVAGPLASWVALVSEVLGRQAWSSVLWPPFNAYWLVLYYGGFLLLRARLANRSKP